MTGRVLLDTGPLVAYLNRRDAHHEWAVAAWDRIEAPFLTCEAVLSETCFILAQSRLSESPVFELLERRVIAVAFQVAVHAERLRWLMDKYRAIPMSFADACLVRMSELHPRSEVMTVDGDFRIYRRNGRQVIPTIMPGP